LVKSSLQSIKAFDAVGTSRELIVYASLEPLLVCFLIGKGEEHEGMHRGVHPCSFVVFDNDFLTARTGLDPFAQPVGFVW
jgi:hypothetical protein